MRKKTIAFIIAGMLFLVILTVGVFLALTAYMSKQTEADVRNIAAAYLEGVTEEEIYNYQSISDIRYTQIEYLKKRLDALGSDTSAEVVRKTIKDSAEYQDVVSCTLVGKDGSLETAYGPELLEVGNQDYLLENLSAGKDVVMTGKNETGELITWASPGSYPMADGQQSVGVLYCRPIAQFIEKLHLDTDKGLADFFVIRRDGSYVVRTGKTTEDNYFERVLAHGTPVGATCEEKVEELKSAIEQDGPWAIEVTFKDAEHGIDERRSVRADPLPNSNWYLVSILPYGVLDEMIDSISQSRYHGMMVSLAVLLAGILLVVALYVRMTRGQVRALEQMHQTAISAQQEAESANKKLYVVAHTDGLTGLWNRMEIQRRITEAVEQYHQQDGKPLCLIMADIDHFKRVNDTYGHQEGDVVIKQIASLMQEFEKNSPDTVSAGRWGGEEFMLLVKETGRDAAQRMAEKLRKAFEAHEFEVSGTHTTSIGVTEVAPADTADILVARADGALYESKKNGRNQVTIL